MADYYTAAVMNPFIPKQLVTEDEINILQRFGFRCEPTDQGNALYFWAEEYCSSGYANPEVASRVFPEKKIDFEEEVDLCEDDLLDLLMGIIQKSEGCLKYISIEAAMTCSKMCPDGFGGFAMFITADKCENTGTGQWLAQKEDEFNKAAATI